jgi:hypothetical protein
VTHALSRRDTCTDTAHGKNNFGELDVKEDERENTAKELEATTKERENICSGAASIWASISANTSMFADWRVGVISWHELSEDCWRKLRGFFVGSGTLGSSSSGSLVERRLFVGLVFVRWLGLGLACFLLDLVWLGPHDLAPIPKQRNTIFFIITISVDFLH